MSSCRLRLLVTILAVVLTSLLLAAGGRGSMAQDQPGTATPTPSVDYQSEIPPAPQSQRPPPSLRFERLSIEDGLSQNAVWHVLQDRVGFMWFGTQDGLNKYDGHTFTVYRHDPDDPQSLRDDYISAMYEDRSGVLWFGTQAGWLEKYDREQDQFIHYQIDSWITTLIEDRSGAFWVGGQGGLFRFDSDTEESRLTTADHGWIERVYEDRAGQLWFGTEDGRLTAFDPGNGQFADYTVGAPVTAIHEDQVGMLWVGTLGGGLARFDREMKRFTYHQNDSDDPHSLSENAVFAIAEDHAGTLWIGTSGLDRFDRETGSFTHYKHNPSDPHSLSNNSVVAVYLDRSGVLWTGNEFGGINKLAAGARFFSHYRHISGDPNSLSGDIVTSVSEDHEGVLWVGTVAGLDRLDRRTGQWQHYQHNPDDPDSIVHSRVRSIYVDRSGAVWVGTSGGLDRYDPKTDRFIHYEDTPVVMWMHEGPSGTLWLATKSGLYRLDRESDHWTLLRAADAWMIMVLEDRSGVVWAGTSGDGLYRYDPTSGEWTHYRHDLGDPHSLSNDSVESIHEDASGVLWLATRGGLDRFDPQTETFVHYRVQDGLANDGVMGILEDMGGNLWLSTAGGLSKFDPQTETFKSYYANDGLQGNSFWRNSYYESPSGEMFFGGENGFSAFFPGQIVDNPHAPPIVITALSLFNEVIRTDVPPDEHISLSHKDNFLSFDFAALDYNNPQKNQYVYWMAGIDEDWVYAGTRRHADYPNLPPGDYVFRVKGSNNDGVWNEEGMSLRITITPPFWQTWWFRGLVLLALVGVSFGGYRLRVRSVEARSHELERQVAERTAELQREIEQRAQVEEALRESEREKAVTEERSRLARELHDAVTQTLFSASLIAEVLPRMWEMDQERGRRQLEEVRSLTRGALAEMRTLLLELRPEVLAKARMGDLLRQLGRAMTGRTGVPVAVSIDGEGPIPPEVQIALYRIAQEALNNVTKHADASQVEVSFCCAPAPSTKDQGPGTTDGVLPKAEQTDDGTAIVELRVSDNGRGFDPGEVLPGHFGLGIMRERAESVGAQLEIESKPGHGTKVVVVWTTDDGRGTTEGA